MLYIFIVKQLKKNKMEKQVKTNTLIAEFMNKNNA